MKVVLLKDLKGVGKKDTIVESADGYALNFLIPQGFAVQATTEKVGAVQKRVEDERTQSEAKKKVLAEDLKKLDGATITLHARCNEHGLLFRGIHVDEVVAKIVEHGAHITAGMLHDVSTIKKIGDYPIRIVAGDVSARVVIAVQSLQTKN